MSEINYHCLSACAFNLGRPWEKPMSQSSSGSSRPLDLYFISVRGGFRPLNQQTHLLKQMEKAAKTYKARFVINISELGEDDQLTQCKTMASKFNKMTSSFTGYLAFFNTESSLVQYQSFKRTGNRLLPKADQIPFGKTLDIIGFDTGAFKDVYLSGEGCSDYARKDSIAYIRNPGSIDEKLPLASVNGISGFSKGMVNGFLLHRVSSLEIETYFVNSAGEVVHDIVLQQRGKAAM
ncbi:hypothetical protein CK203_056960 [Vitis vinifera]|uniref:Uncharacterized protein n=1 Tax=Vitis vinifera TaxID=29760 RepID=A0A438GN59_VITVI|nr:hypothetical protein CK203_056960 [Vitis vinifera]